MERCIDDEAPFELPYSWCWQRLCEVYNFIDYRGTTPTKTPSGIPFVTAKNVRWGYIDYSVDEYISEEDYIARQSRGVSHKGDILFTTEAPLGNVAIADLDQFSAGQRLITFQQYSREHELNNELMMFFLLSDAFQSQLIENCTGTTVKGIKAERLKRLLIPIPPVDEQIRLLRTIRLLLSITKGL